MKKRLLLIVTFWAISFGAGSQNLQYSYDVAGNRINRKQVSTRSLVTQNAGVDSVFGANTLPVINIDSIIIQSNGDTLYSYVKELFDFGDIYDYPDTLVSELISSSASENSLSFGNLSATIDRTKYVGAIPYEYGQLPSGGKTYTIPFATVPVNGISPQIALKYNSLAGNGLAGMGWDLEGVSMITLANKNIYYDGEVAAGIVNSSNQVYMLDGIRLVPSSKVAGFTLETVQGQIVVQPHFTNDVATYFTARYPDGVVATFGETLGSARQYCFPLTSVTDSRGYRLDLEYVKDGNRYLISKIKYGGRTATTHPAYLEFQYDSRNDIPTVYIGGEAVTLNKKLKKVISYNDSKELRTYTLTYQLQGVNLLTQLDCSVGSASLNPLKFEYGSNDIIISTNSLIREGSRFLTEYFDTSTGTTFVYGRGRFQNSRYEDGLIVYPGFSIYSELAHSSSGHYQFGSKFSPNQDLLISPSITFLSTVRKIKAEDGFQLLTAVDIDGDGVDEMVKVNSTVVSGKNQLKITTYEYNNDNFTASVSNLNLEGVINDGGLLSPISRSYYLGDFNGDGKVELLTVSHNKTFKGESRTCYFTLINLQTRSIITNNQNCFSHATDEGDYIYAMDHDGDGKTDLCRITSNGTEFYSYAKQSGVNTFVKMFTSTGLYRSSLTGGRKVYITDFNADGKADIVVSPEESTYYQRHVRVEEDDYGCSTHYVEMDASFSGYDILSYHYPWPDYNLMMCASLNGSYYVEDLHQWENVISIDKGSNWKVYQSNGAGDFVSKDLPFVHNQQRVDFTFQDLNMDGYPDVIEKNSDGFMVYLNQNGTYSSTPTIPLQQTMGTTYLIPFNMNQMYMTGQFITIENAEVISYSLNRDESKERMLTGMVDSYGVRHANTYANMTNLGAVYLSGTATAYPYVSFLAPMNLLQQSQIYQGNTLVSNERYTYYGAVMHYQGLGFCGFQKMRTVDALRNERTTVAEYNPSLWGVMTKLDSPVRTLSYSYQNYTQGKTSNPRITSITETDKVKGNTISKSYQYDSYYYPSKETITWDSGVTTVTSQTYTHINGGRYILGLPLLETVTQTRAGSTWMETKEMSYTDNGLPTSQINKTQGAQIGKVAWTYNSGNVASEKSAPHMATELLGNTYSYDTAVRYILSKTDALGRVTEYSAYDQFANPKSIKDYLGKTTTYNYDTWGRLNSINNPDGTVETRTCSWDTTVGTYMISRSVTGQPAERTYYDALGRDVRSGVLRFDGSWQCVDKQYDSYGRLWRESLPFKGATASLWNTYAYDGYDRITSLTEASGKVTTYSYSGNSETVTKDGIASTHTYDKSGLLVSVTDPAGSITYTYRPDGQLKNTVAPGGVTTTFDYDATYGYRNKIIDPSAGTMTFAESYSGNILTVSRTDANAKTVTTVYDKYGRPTSKVQPEFTTTYSYDATTKNLSGESSTNGSSHTYTYDGFGRISTEKEVAADNVWMQRAYSYSTGNVSSVVYSSSKEGTIGTENLTYANGHLTEVKLGTTSVWKLTAENALGQPTTAVTGPLTRTYAYTAYGMPTERKVGSIQQFAYSFDALKGNLTNRTDKKRSISESFGYDNLNRLTSYGGKTTGYDVKGNTTSMSGIGTMSYSNSGKPYAVTGISLSSSQIPTRTQEVTYTSFQRPATISENGYVATITYNASGDRTKMQLTYNGATQNTTYYIGGCYETNNTETHLYLAGNYYSSPIVYVKKSGSWGIYYICRDYLGSITHVTNSSGTLQQELSYDAWGRLRNPVNQVLYAPGAVPTPFLGRGYAGHEHLALFGLINMNARLYDSALGRFLSPDPYVQMIDFSQNFNRYSYALNNPLVYVDGNGKFFFSAILGFWKGIFQGKNPLKTAWQSVKNETKIYAGLFTTDKYKNFWQQSWEFVSRFTWQLPQTMLGEYYSIGRNAVGLVDEVRYRGGATYVVNENSSESNGVTIGNFININDRHSIPRDEKGKFAPELNQLYMHEYGHYLQSQEYGWGFLLSVGIKSLFSAKDSKQVPGKYYTTHSLKWYEIDASRRGKVYFQKHYNAEWNEDKNPTYKSNDINFKY